MAEDLRRAYRTVMDDHFPAEMSISFGGQTLRYRKRAWKIRDEDTGEVVEKGLRYGENPGQEAALYELAAGNLELGGCRFVAPGRGLVSALAEEHLRQFGKHPGKINLTDVDNALNILRHLMDRPAAAIMKHNNPCGAAWGASLPEVYERAYRADRIAAFGGAAVVNRALDCETARQMAGQYLEVVAAPAYEEGAVAILKGRKNLRIIEVPRLDKLAEYREERVVEFKSLIDGGIVVQQSPLNAIRSPADFKPAAAEHKGKKYQCRRQPTAAELDDLFFGWAVEQGVTSNSVLYVKNGATVGIGTGEQDRVGVAEIAVFKAYTKHADLLAFARAGLSLKELEAEIAAGKRASGLREEIERETRAARGGLKGAAMVSDAFFPFRDGLDVGLKEGITAVVQPGGAQRDWEAIEACNEAEPPAAMVFTGQRAFKH